MKKEADAFDDPWNTDSYDDEDGADQQSRPSRRRSAPSSGGTGLKVGLLAGGGVALLGVVVFAISTFLKSNSSSTVNNGGAATTNTAMAGLTPGPGGDLSGSAEHVQGSMPGGMPGMPPSGMIPQPSEPGAGIQPGGSAGNFPAATAAISGENRKLRYHWKPGAEHMYQFTVEQGSGDNLQKTTGICSYSVRGDSRQIVSEEEGSGTGFVISADGIIATCAHVVEGAKRMEVHLNGQTFPATAVAVDPKSDVALIRVSASGLNALPLADSDTVQLAESVRAIGYPLSDVLGTDVKVTTGTVAGIIQNRERGKQIQIDAAINPGNSGGPVVNGAGQVIGIASAKLSGSSVTSVGFAAPVNQLRALAASSGLQLPIVARGQELAGPEIARRVTPSVAYIKVWGSSGGKMYEVAFNANFHEQPQAPSMRGGFPMRPSFGNTSMDHGQLTVNALGEVLEFEGTEQLPAVLGPVGVFFLEPLDAYSESQWHVEKESNLQRIKRDEGPFGGMGPRIGGRMRGPRGFGPPGLAPPGFGGQEDQVLEEIPAVERVSYQTGQSLNNKVSITKTYEFTATRSNNQPYLNIRGTGTLVFDLEQGMPASLEYSATIEQSDEGAQVKVPVRVSYTLRNPDEVKRERDEFAKKAEADRLQKEQEKNVANPTLVDELIAAIRQAEGGFPAAQPLGRLGEIAVVDDKREEVLRVARNHMKNSNGFVKKSATEAFCNWATGEHVDDLKAVLSDQDGLLHEAKKRAVRTLAKLLKPDEYSILINAMSDFVIRADIKEALISVGPSVEPAILEGFDQITDASARNELLEVLKKVGTEKSVSFLDKLATSGDFSVKHNAQQALDAVRARL